MNKQQLPFIPSFEEGETIPVSYRNPFEWVESSYVDVQAPRPEFMGRTVTDRRLTTLYWIMASILILFACRSAYLQIMKGTGFALLAEKNKTRVITSQAHRGVFFDRNGKILVRNTPDFSLVTTPIDLPNDVKMRDEIIHTISSLAMISESEIREQLKNHDRYRPFLLKDHLSYEQALKLEVTLRGVQGVEIAVSEKRSYEMTPQKSVSHIFGYTGRISEEQLEKNPGEYMLTDSIGKSGLELAYEDLVRGIAGKKEVEVDALGHEKGVVSEKEGQDGSNLVLSLDWNMQIKAEEVLIEIMKKTGKEKGVVIVSNPANGEIISYASLPAYDVNVFAEGIKSTDYEKLLNDQAKPLLNRGMSGEYPSGSTIKMLVAAAALQEGVMSKKSTVLSSGGIHIGEWFFPDWKAGGHGVTNVIKALAESVNTYFYIAGGGYQDRPGLGIDRLVAYFHAFGIGEETHVDFQKERAGFLPSPEWKMTTRKEPWYIGDTYHVAIGQGDVLVTPLQVHMYTSYFAQNGVSYQPRMVHALQGKNNTTSASVIPPKVLKKDVVSQETVQIVREGLRAGVTAGSSRRLSALPVEAAGKTGTAQWSSSKSPHAWFTGWAPYEHPQLVITVLIEEGEEGSRTAVAVAHDFLQWYFREYTKIGAKTPSE